MGLISGLLGNASQIDPKEVQTQYAQILLPEEEVQRAYQLIRDSFIFTTRRLILVDVQGVTGSKVSYLSLPYRSIAGFAVESAGTFDLDAELKIWVRGQPAPILKKFNKKVNIYDVQRVLAHYVLQ